MTYVVCQTSHCQQTYPLEYFGEVTKETKNVSCEKCGGVLIGNDGRANFSQNSAVIPVITIQELEEQKERSLEKKRNQIKQLEKEIKVLEEED